jgi:hypothetical protein
MDEALREEGLDEHKVAEILAGVVNRVEKQTVTARVDDKLLMDLVKVVSPHLDSARRTAPASAESDAPVTINLIHNVQRPVRPTAPEPASASNTAPEPASDAAAASDSAQ